jgi:hypothetical protein
MRCPVARMPAIAAKLSKRLGRGAVDDSPARVVVRASLVATYVDAVRLVPHDARACPSDRA